MRRTKIICTLGPATDNYATIKKLVKAGMNVARINMSHGNYEEHKARIDMIKKAREELDVPIAILLDTKGPEIRIKTFEGGKATLADGDYFTLTTDDIVGNNARVAITYPLLPTKVKKDDQILINDGLIELRVEEVAETDIVCVVVAGGELTNRKSINLPNNNIDMPYMSEVDKRDITFGVEQDVDYFAMSFVRNKEDVLLVRSFVESLSDKKFQYISKLENRSGVDHVDEILESGDGVMIARGDLGVEIPFEELPGIQKTLIKKCYRAGKKVITATQMLESMINNPRPTRAEISDVANAIFDGTSAIMLSGETAVGKFCIDAVKTMAKIAEKAESNINFKKRFANLDPEIKTITDAVSHSTCAAAYDLSAKAIIAVSRSGYTARKVSRFRPECPIIAATTSIKAYHQLALNWGVVPVLAEVKSNSDELFVHSLERAKSTGLLKTGDLVVITAGVPVGVAGNTNTMRIEII